MPMEKNSVKISVADEDGAHQRIIKNQISGTKVAPKKPAYNNLKIKNDRSPKKPKINKTPRTNGAGRLMGTAVVFALVVGGGIYVWQQKTNSQALESAREDAREIKISFEQRLDNLKNKLSGVETENNDLKDKTEELAARAKILELSKIEFNNDELNMSFEYPAAFGEVKITFDSQGTGTRASATFSHNDKLEFGGISDDYDSGEGEIVITPTEIRGFTYRRGDYYLNGPNEKELLIKPFEIIAIGREEAILIDKNSFTPDPNADGLSVDIGENVVLVVNLDNDKFPGVAFVNMDYGRLPLEAFIKLAKTIKQLD